MAIGDGFYSKAKAKIEAQVGEPVEVLGWASRSGAMGAVISGELLRGVDVASGNPIGLGASVPRGNMAAAGGGKGAKLPMNFLVALTPSAFRVFALRKTWTGLKLKKELGTLPRDGLQLAVEDGGVTKRFQLEATDGSGIAFEMTRSKFATTFADSLRSALG
jgi:hypothetical protein